MQLKTSAMCNSKCVEWGGSGLLQAQKYIPVFPSEIIGEKITQ